MNILVVNWQDRENPNSGGAEIHLHEIFGRLAARGHRVTLLCGGWPGAPRRTVLDGIDVHRVGTRYTFQFHARGYWRRVLARRSDEVLVEDLNKIPLFTPRWTGAPPVVPLVHHLFGEIAFQEAPLPMAALVWLAERPLARVYRGCAFQAVSRSTADDLVRRGVAPDAITVIHQGIDAERFTPDRASRAAEPVVAYVGRLKKYKRIDLVLRAFAELPDHRARLEIAGAGDGRPALERLARSLDLGDRVQFLGFVSEAEKVALLRRSWTVVLASPKEGWGITNLEAAACGTPVVASNSPGIRESVRDGETGLLVPHGDVTALRDAIMRLLASPRMVEEMGAAGRRFAERFTWERATNETESHLTAAGPRGG